MTVLTKIRPKEPLKTLKWVDILIVTIIMFGEFIIRSTQQFLQSLQPVTQVARSIRRRQRPIATGQRIRVTLPTSNCTLVLSHPSLRLQAVEDSFSLVRTYLGTGIIHDCRTVRRRRNYAERRIQLLRPSTCTFVNPQEIVNKFLALSPMALLMGC